MTYLLGNHPFLKLNVQLPKNKWKRIDCLIDTGFSGGLALPQSFKEYFPQGNFIEAHFTLANGSEIVVDSTYTKVEHNGRQREVAVVFMGNSGGLVGVEFLDQMKFCLDLKSREVILEE